MERFEIAVVGSGFAGTILARILHRVGVRVVLIERHEHPRFAIGESSTPLAAICLERLAQRYGLEDLSWLAAYGRWLAQMPEVRRGLKRGFTFWGHRAGERFADTPANERRLLVAASPDDAIADSHWLRADVDHALVERAIAEGVEYRDRLEIQDLARNSAGGWRLAGRWKDRPVELEVEAFVDATGSGGLLGGALAIPEALDQVDLDTALVFSHFGGVEPLAGLSPGPYPDERAAVHHLIEEGWIYALPFDHDVVSAGLILPRPELDRLRESGVDTPEALWESVLSRYPSLEAQYAGATPQRPLELMPRVQRLRSRAAGRDWAMLPHTFAFFDPMFSTGIAWSLLAVERLAFIFETASQGGSLDASVSSSGLERYGRQLPAEAKQTATLLEGAWAAMQDFELLTSQSFLYFAVVSFAEVEQRLFPQGRTGDHPAWHGFLGAGDPTLERSFREAKRRLESIPRQANGVASRQDREAFGHWVLEAIADRNIGGFGDPRRRNLYPVDLDLLIDRAPLLGMTPEAMRSKLPLLRGAL